MKFLRSGLLSLLLLAFMAPAASVLAQGSALLRYKVNIGDKFTYETVTDQVISQNIMGMEQVIKQKITMVYDMEVIGENAGVYEIRNTYRKAKFSMDGGALMGTVEYDSENPPAEVEAMARGYAALVGQTFTYHTNQLGEIVSVSGLSEMMDAIVNQFGDLPEAELEAMRTSLESQYGDTPMSTNLQAASPAFPEKKVKVGKSWERSYTQNTGFSMDINSVYTVKSLAGDEAVIASALTTTTDPESAMEMSGMTLKYNMSGTGSGEVRYAKTTGVVTQSTTTQSINGDVNASGGMMGEGMSWPITIESTTTLNLIK